MSPLRFWVAHITIGVILIGSLACIVTDREYWPFSQYPMFSKIEQETDLALQLVGVTAPEMEMPLKHKHVWPFDLNRLGVALRRIRNNADPEMMKAALRDCLERYEGRRVRGAHDWPPLQAVRLYELRWINRNVRSFNVDRPDRRTLVAEVAHR